MNRGFTLLEMTVVVAVIAIVTHLAMREIGHYRGEKLSQAADRQLADVREAARRFLSDVGRLPRLAAATNREGETVWTLSELWKRPSNLVECRRVENVGVNFAVGSIVFGCGVGQSRLVIGKIGLPLLQFRLPPLQLPDLLQRTGNIRCLGIKHRLNNHRGTAADENTAYIDLFCHLYHPLNNTKMSLNIMIAIRASRRIIPAPWR